MPAEFEINHMNKRIDFLPAGHTRSAQLAGPKITLSFPHLYIYLCVQLLCVATMGIVLHNYEFEMDTETQRQRRSR